MRLLAFYEFVLCAPVHFYESIASSTNVLLKYNKHPERLRDFDDWRDFPYNKRISVQAEEDHRYLPAVRLPCHCVRISRLTVERSTMLPAMCAQWAVRGHPKLPRPKSSVAPGRSVCDGTWTPGVPVPPCSSHAAL
jgi:hypothetical protein